MMSGTLSQPFGPVNPPAASTDVRGPTAVFAWTRQARFRRPAWLQPASAVGRCVDAAPRRRYDGGIKEHPRSARTSSRALTELRWKQTFLLWLVPLMFTVMLVGFGVMINLLFRLMSAQ